MRLTSLIIIALLVLFSGCSDSSENQKDKFILKTSTKQSLFKLNDTLSLDIENVQGLKVESVKYFFNDKPIEQAIILSDMRLGHHQIKAEVKYEGGTEELSSTITLVNNEPPKVYNFVILNEYPHDITSFTQGLEFHGGYLYESTGNRGKSKLRKIEHETATVIQDIDLKRRYFGEGLTVFNNKIYQLTWQSKTGLIYDLETLERTGSFKYGQSVEGWGICHDDTYLYKSDGTEKIWRLDPETLTEIDYIQAFTHKGKIVGLNELEWVNGKIYANRWQKNGVAIINPKNGAIEGVIDFSSLREKVTQHPQLDVLNGIAYNPETQTIFVTGKNWDKLFEVSIIE